MMDVFGGDVRLFEFRLSSAISAPKCKIGERHKKEALSVVRLTWWGYGQY